MRCIFQPFCSNGSFEWVVHCRWKPLALHISLKYLHKTGNWRTTVLLKPFCSVFVDNLIISAFTTGRKLKLLQDESLGADLASMSRHT